METIDIFKYNKIEGNDMIPFSNKNLISSILEKKHLVKKQHGLCAPPWNKYYSFSHQDERGVSISEGYINVCYITVNQATSTYSRTVLYYSICIIQTIDGYYLKANAQCSRYNETKGAEHVVYKCTEEELESVLDKIFIDVK